MELLRKNLKNKLATPFRISVLVILVLMALSFWQQVRMYSKDRAIAKLEGENIALKNDLFSLDDQLAELKDTASDVRIFQKELIKVIKDIDQNYPVSFASSAHHAHHSAHPESQNPHLALKNASENLLVLSSSQANLRVQTASLLGRAVSMRDVLSQTPSMLPVGSGYISSDFGMRQDPFTKGYKRHHGIDIAAPLGTPVFASADGKVKIASRNRSFGNLIELEHADGYATSYAHLSEILVRKDQRVKRGQEIGRVGKTGTRCQGSHVHFEVKKRGVRQDPKPYLVASPPSFF